MLATVSFERFFVPKTLAKRLNRTPDVKTKSAALSIEVSTQDLVFLTGIPARTLTHWSREGAISPIRRGTWNLAETVAAIVRRLRGGAADGSTRDALLREQTRRLELMNASAVKEQVPRSECEDGWRMLAGLFVTELEALPGRIAGEVLNLSSPSQAREIILGETRRSRQRVADELHSISAKLREQSNGRRQRR